MSFKGFSIFCSGSHFVQRSRTIWVISVEDLQRNNPIIFGWNPPSSRRDVILSKLWTTHARRQTQGDHNSSPCACCVHVVLRWAKKQWNVQNDCQKNKLFPSLFVCVEVLRPSQPNGVMSSAVSLPNHTFTGQAKSSKWLTSNVHILLPETDNCPSWICWRERMTVENISWSNLHERMLLTRWGLNPQPPDHQSKAHPTEPPRPAFPSLRRDKW